MTTLPRLSGIIFPADHGGFTSANLQSIFTELGTNPATVMLTAGDWIVSDGELLVAPNITLILLRGAKFVFSTNADSINLQTCEFQAPPDVVFDGVGSVDGASALVAYDHSSWEGPDLINYSMATGYISSSAITVPIASSTDIEVGTENAEFITPAGLASATLSANSVPQHNELRGVSADQHRRIHVSAGVPTGGQDGDIWIQYA